VAQGVGETGSSWVVSEAFIGACVEVHRNLGPGLLETAYEECLCLELESRGIRFVRQQAMPVFYRGSPVDCGYRLDLIVENALVVELKAVERLLPIHEAQLLTYLKLSGYEVGLLINFNVPILTRGIRRLRYPKTPETQQPP
jgi:GxxExxY protein